MASSSISGILKRKTVYFLWKFKVFDFIRAFERNTVKIIMYHRFSANEEVFKISKETFEKQIKFLKKHYSIIAYKQYIDALDGKIKKLPDNPIIITIDDGYQDNYEYAYPILKKYKVPAILFVTTDFISKKKWLWANKLEFILKNTNDYCFALTLGEREVCFNVETFKGWHTAQLEIYNYCRSLDDPSKDDFLEKLARSLDVEVPSEVTEPFLPLTWSEIREMADHGIEFGSHTCSHPICSKLSTTALKYELENSKEELEKAISRNIEAFCYPNGQLSDFSEQVVEEVKKSGYKSAVTTITGFNFLSPKQNPYVLKRISLSASDCWEIALRILRG